MDDQKPLNPQAPDPNQQTPPQPSVIPAEQFFQPSVAPAPVPNDSVVQPTATAPQVIAPQQNVTQPDVAPQPTSSEPQTAASPQPVSAQTEQPTFGGQVPPVAQPTATTTPENQTDVLGIISIVLFFVFSLAGFIVGIVGIRRAKKRGYKPTLSIIGTVLNGLVFLLIIPIMLVLILTTYNGVQTKARDTERQTDINGIHAQVEEYYAQKGVYPLLSELNDSSWRQTNMAGLDNSGLTDPRNQTDSTLKSVPTVGYYSYQVYEVDNVTPCTIASKCATYTLTALLDSTINGSSTFTKTSLN